MAGQKSHNTGLIGHSTCSSRLFDCLYKGLIFILIAMRNLHFFKRQQNTFAVSFTNGQLMELVNGDTAIPIIQACFPSSFHHTLVCISKSNPFTTKCGIKIPTRNAKSTLR
jgi:hypothetical protein